MPTKEQQLTMMLMGLQSDPLTEITDRWCTTHGELRLVECTDGDVVINGIFSEEDNSNHTWDTAIARAQELLCSSQKKN